MLAIIAAVAKNNVIGKNNDLPWHIPEDLKHFQKLTSGKTVLMGQKTFESILNRLGKPLPNRLNVVLSQTPGYEAPKGVLVYASLSAALERFQKANVCIIGGGSVYRQTIDLASDLFITHVDEEPEGDAFFPEINSRAWAKIFEEKHQGFSFAHYVRPRVFSQTFCVVGALLEKSGKILLVKEAHNTRDRGKWSHPAGWLEPVQDIITGVKTEVLEETGYKFEPEHPLGIYSLVRSDLYDPARGGTPHAVKLIFVGKILADEPQPLADDVSEIKWFTPQEIYDMDQSVLRDFDIKGMVQDYFAGKRFSLGILHDFRQRPQRVRLSKNTEMS